MPSPYSDQIILLKAQAKKFLFWGIFLMVIGMMIMLSFPGIITLIPYSVGSFLLVTALQKSFQADNLKEKETDSHTDKIIPAG